MSYRPVQDFPRSNQPGRSTTLNHDQHLRALNSGLRSNDGTPSGHDLIPDSTCPKSSTTGMSGAAC